jgi:hypothetical protein
MLQGEAPRMEGKWMHQLLSLSKRDDTSTDTATRAAHCGLLLEGLGLSYVQLDGSS